MSCCKLPFELGLGPLSIRNLNNFNDLIVVGHCAPFHRKYGLFQSEVGFEPFSFEILVAFAIMATERLHYLGYYSK